MVVKKTGIELFFTAEDAEGRRGEYISIIFYFTEYTFRGDCLEFIEGAFLTFPFPFPRLRDQQFYDSKNCFQQYCDFECCF